MHNLGKLDLIEPGLALFNSFGNLAFVFGRGQVLVVDTGWRVRAVAAVSAIRAITKEPFSLIVYTHSHTDHVTGTKRFLEDAALHGHPKPTIWAHERVSVHLRRYVKMAGWEAQINSLQFGIQIRSEVVGSENEYVYPDYTFDGHQNLELAGEAIELHYAKGETDDATWVWLPERQAALVGDLIVSSIPNSGNPTKPQRYTLEWSEALETIAARKPRLLLPGHGPAYRGAHCCELLHETARALRLIHDEVILRLNSGEWPVDIIEANITLPPRLADKPYLRPIYGCVPFIVRDVLARYAGWWSGRPSELFPVTRGEHAMDIVRLCGRIPLIRYSRALIQQGEYERAVALAEIVANSDPTDVVARTVYAEALEQLAAIQTSFIARNLLLGSAERLLKR